MSTNKGFQQDEEPRPPPYNENFHGSPGGQPILMQPMGTSRTVDSEYQYDKSGQDGQSMSYSSRSHSQTTQFQGQSQYYHQQQQQHQQQFQYQSHFQQGSPVITIPPSAMRAQQQTIAIPANVPRGLEGLVHLDRIFIKQKIELLEILTGCETQNKYKILDPYGQQLFSAKEDTDCCTRNCLGSLRPFDIKIKDGYDQEIIHLSRPFGCGSCCFPCCLQSIDVFSPPGTLVGRLEQDWTLIIPKFRVLNAEGECVLRIKGPFCTISCCNDVEFLVLSPDGAVEVGKISKKWSGLVKEYFTDADNFGLSFPMDLDVKMKAVMIGACLLIDFMFFEHSENNNRNHHF